MKTRLLLVEDDATLARAIARLLRRAGYDVFLAAGCEEARRAPGSYSLGVFDVDLPDGDGIALAEELLKKATVRRLVFFSGTHDAERRAGAARLGPFVDKGMGFQALQSALEQLLMSRRARVVGAESAGVGGSSTPPPSGVRQNGKPKD